VKAFYRAAVAALTTVLTACGTQAAGQQAGQPAAATATATAAPARTATASSQVAGTARAQPSSPVPDRPVPTLTGPAALTAADNGAVVRLHTGQQVTVRLTPQGFFSWHVPVAAGAAIKRLSASGGYPGQQPAQAAFLAVRPGEATLTTIDDTACLHARPACQPPQREWRVTVIVTSG
jgi:hypothetical protein